MMPYQPYQYPKRQLLIWSLLFVSFVAFGQISGNKINGNISFISSENVYVRFVSTKGINSGDTLFSENGSKLQPAIVVSGVSSMSCVGKPVGNYKPVLMSALIAFVTSDIPVEVNMERNNEPVSVNDIAIHQNNSLKKNVSDIDKTRLSGRFSISSYNYFSSDSLSATTPAFRLKYNLSLHADHISGSRFSFENYMSFTHLLFDSKENYNDLKVYHLNFRYDCKDSSSFIFGRKINPNTANVGAVDGLQYEKNFKNFSLGGLVGCRPNDVTYGFDPHLFQFGAFISSNLVKHYGYAQTSLAFFNQTNELRTDRRYLYLQHSNSLLKNVDFFGSAEIDLFSVEQNTSGFDFDLTSLYLSLSYRPFKILALSLSFDERKNVYYFETYKSKLDSLLENEMRQGLRFRFNLHPIKYLTWGATAGYRMQTPTSYESANASTYLTYSNVPWINASLTLTADALSSNNYSGWIYGASFSKDIGSKISLDIDYRKSQIFSQNVIDIGFLWRATNSIFLSADAEASVDANETLGRIFINISKRF